MVRTGAERLAEDPGLAGAGRFGLITNFTGVLRDLRPTTSAFLAASLPLTGSTLDQPWVPRSPNMPTLDTALVYPGMGLFEGTNVSEGRGTTRPFETIGAPFFDRRLVPALRDLPGVAFRSTWFEPVFSKYAGQVLPGVQLHVLDRQAFRPVRTALVILRTLRDLYSDELTFRPELDRLWGSDSLRKALIAGDDPLKLLTDPGQWVDPAVLLYEGGATG